MTFKLQSRCFREDNIFGILFCNLVTGFYYFVFFLILLAFGIANRVIRRSVSVSN